ncbi:threonine aldolase family protein [Croceimicrobium hydrocarbonivorans]|uniref:Threonine aldolase n=1 Tax=Croceimicrobium hydrocarbonivorans TaxID=2761580 RepID=A0A7H0VBP6_9FLAO|nr:GntG family PLP-dependent aldolase [Croceimicrobium hydrocarbonivorans]QNR23144.1 threonine aldolase [Croceimicrobium hydrocarbonivorans]
MIDLRSDTFTKPLPAMQKAMWAAEVGDDVFGEDPTINKLEAKAAEMFGMEAAVFCPSGTMTNQIAIKTHTVPGQEVICHEYSHVYNYEGGGIAFNSACQVRPLRGPKGKLEAAEVAASLQNPLDHHAATSRLVVLENTSNKGGGACYDLETIDAIREITSAKGLGLHLDGARLWNALVATGQKASDYGRRFDSISVCLSKGLGCPVGSLLLGSKDFIHEARFIRKKLGGAMRQAGYLAAAGIYALDHHIDRLAEDHEKARRLAQALEASGWVEPIETIETNILIFNLKPEKSIEQFNQHLRQAGILHIDMGQGKQRFVTHHDVSMEMTERTCAVIADLNK